MSTITLDLEEYERLAAGDPAARERARWECLRAEWARIAATEDNAKRTRVIRDLCIDCDARHRPLLTTADRPIQKALDRLRYRFCERTLKIGFALTSCKGLPLRELQKCLDALDAENLESLDRCAPPERELEFAA